jgi:2-(3-amino-3-carboxypropyl)histidine synthase
MPDEKDIVSGARKKGFRKVLIQVPEGLKAKGQKLADAMEKAGISAIICADPCFGACDIRDREALSLGCDGLVHLGHSDFGLASCVPVLYCELQENFNPVSVLQKNIFMLEPFRKVALSATLQYLPALGRAAEFLKTLGKEALIGRPEKAGHPGQILGCDYSGPLSLEKSADCFIIISGGMFHPLGLAAKTRRSVFVLDPETRTLKDITAEARKKMTARASKAEWAKGMEKFIILAGTKRGQLNIAAADAVKKRLEGLGKSAWIVSADLFTPSALMGLKCDCLVNCACPRLSDDSEMFGKIILDAEDVLGW